MGFGTFNLIVRYNLNNFGRLHGSQRRSGTRNEDLVEMLFSNLKAVSGNGQRLCCNAISLGIVEGCYAKNTD